MDESGDLFGGIYVRVAARQSLKLGVHSLTQWCDTSETLVQRGRESPYLSFSIGDLERGKNSLTL